MEEKSSFSFSFVILWFSFLFLEWTLVKWNFLWMTDHLISPLYFYQKKKNASFYLSLNSKETFCRYFWHEFFQTLFSKLEALICFLNWWSEGYHFTWKNYYWCFLFSFSTFKKEKKKKNIYYKKSFDRFKLVMWSKILQLSTNQYKDRGSILKEIQV